MGNFSYTDAELEALKKIDPRLKEVIERVGPVEEELDADLFSSIIHHVLGQQISSTVQQHLWERVNSFGKLTPELILGLGREKLRELGMSYRKADTILRIAEAVKSGELDLESLWEMTDDEVIAALTKFKGIGPWTAEMVLMFGMERKDVFSFGDIALKRGIKKVLEIDELSREEFEEIRRRFSPHGTLACLYFWVVGEGRD